MIHSFDSIMLFLASLTPATVIDQPPEANITTESPLSTRTLEPPGLVETTSQLPQTINGQTFEEARKRCDPSKPLEDHLKSFTATMVAKNRTDLGDKMFWWGKNEKAACLAKRIDENHLPEVRNCSDRTVLPPCSKPQGNSIVNTIIIVIVILIAALVWAAALFLGRRMRRGSKKQMERGASLLPLAYRNTPVESIGPVFEIPEEDFVIPD